MGKIRSIILFFVGLFLILETAYPSIKGIFGVGSAPLNFVIGFLVVIFSILEWVETKKQARDKILIAARHPY